MALGVSLPARIAAAGDGVDIFIAPTGDDSTGDGSIGNPYESPERAFADAGPGDIVQCRGGTYADFAEQQLGASGTAADPIQIRAYQAENPVFPQTDRWLVSNQDYIRVGPGLRFTGDGGQDSHLKITDGSTNVEVVGNEFATTEWHCILQTGATGPTQVWDNDFSGSGSSNQRHLHYVSATLGVCVIANNVYHDHGGGYGLQAYPGADSLIVTCNTFDEFTDRSPIVIGGSTSGATDNLRAVGNICTNAAWEGVHVGWEGTPGSGNTVSDMIGFGNALGDTDPATGVTYTNIVHADPLYDNAGAGDYHISADSSPAKALVPAVREGYVPALDKDGNARQSADAGAYAVGTGSPPPPPDQPPQNITVPSISGSPVDGQTLTGNDGTWANTPTSFTRRWMRCNAAGTSCSAIGGETGTTYVLTGADIGSTIRYEVTAINAEGSTVATSVQTSVVGGVSGGSGAPVNTVAPSISGIFQQGRVLTAGPGTWTGDTPMSFSYQWQRCNAAGGACANIVGATGATRLVAAADVGQTLKVVVTASN